MAQYIHDGPNLYLTADGQVVEEGDTRAATLLVATGGLITPEIEAHYGPPFERFRALARNEIEIQPRELVPGEMLQEAKIVRAGDLPPDTQVIAVEVTVTGIVDGEPGEQIDGQAPEPAIEFTPAPAFEEHVNAQGNAADQDEGKGEKAKEAKPNKVKGPPANKAG